MELFKTLSTVKEPTQQGPLLHQLPNPRFTMWFLSGWYRGTPGFVSSRAQFHVGYASFVKGHRPTSFVEIHSVSGVPTMEELLVLE